MLKITEIASKDSAQTFKLEGKLLEPWVAEVLSVCAGPARSSSIGLDLSAVTFVDAAGAHLLRDLMGQGIAIVACSPFVAELLHMETSDGHAHYKSRR